MPPNQARAFGVHHGLVVLEVDSTAAREAGLRGTYRKKNGNLALGDVITGINGDPVKTEIDAFRALEKLSPGQNVTLMVVRRAISDAGRYVYNQTRISFELQEVEAQGLPAGWTEHVDPISKRHYYYNAGTRKTQWEHPGPV